MPHRPQRDALDAIADHGRRIAALETGAHPVAVEGAVYREIPYAVIDRTGSGTHIGPYTSGQLRFDPFVQVRSGVVTLGGVATTSDGIDADGEPYGRLGEGARPVQDITARMPAARETGADLGTARVTIDADTGVIHVNPPNVGGKILIYLAGLSFPRS